MNTFIKSVLAGAAALAAITASAQPFARMDTREIDIRQARQEQRIERGYASGDLTRAEVRSLWQGQRQIARAEARAKADGHFSRDEMRHLIGLLDRADAQIRRLRHDRHDRDGRAPT